MYKINIVGSIFGTTGYARHTKELTNALHELGVDVKIETSLPQQWQRYVNDFEMLAVQKEWHKEGVTICINLPQYWSLALAQKSKKFYGFCVWEGDKVPYGWKQYLQDKRIDGILVPSEHVRTAIYNTFEKFEIAPVYVIPHGYDPSKFYPEAVEKNEKFRFIATKGWTQGLNDRGGLQFLIKAFAEEFGKEDNVKLLIKLNTAYGYNQEHFEKQMKELDIPLKEERGENIMINIENWSDTELRRFYNEGDVFVNTSMAEGFGIPMLESIACGTPVLTTNFGGQTDFITPNNGWFITAGEYDFYSKEIMYEETKWFKPSIKQIREKLREIYETKKLLTSVSETVKDFTWKKTGEKLLEVVDDKKESLST